MHRIVLLYGARKLYILLFQEHKKINVIQRILDLVQGLQFMLKIYILRLPIKNFSITANQSEEPNVGELCYTKQIQNQRINLIT